jgi:hypothetical protein
MNTILFWFAIGLVVLIVASKIPGLELLVKPIIDLLFSMIKVVSENSYLWFIWLFKLLWNSHADLLNNLFHKAEDLDPSIAVRQHQLPSLNVRRDYFPWMLEWEAVVKSKVSRYFSLKK